jgi:hypothetical protein
VSEVIRRPSGEKAETSAIFNPALWFGGGLDQHFWRLVQAHSALYDSQAEVKRLFNRRLTRKKALAF